MELTGPQVFIENRTFAEIEVGETATLARTLSREDIELFAVMSGDVNPAHLDEDYAHSDTFHAIIAHGMWGASLISTLLGTRLPGPGMIYLEQTLRFHRPVMIADTITVSVTAAAKDPARQRISFDCRCVNQRGEVVIDGTATVIAPAGRSAARRWCCPRFSCTTAESCSASWLAGPRRSSRSGRRWFTPLTVTACWAPSRQPRPG